MKFRVSDELKSSSILETGSPKSLVSHICLLSKTAFATQASHLLTLVRLPQASLYQGRRVLDLSHLLMLLFTQPEVHQAAAAVEDHKVLKTAGEQHWRTAMEKGNVSHCESLESVKVSHDTQGRDEFQDTARNRCFCSNISLSRKLIAATK